jgi:hypothetical protein
VDASKCQERASWSDFERTCFRTLGYFLSVFGPLPLDTTLRASFLNVLKPPLRDWFPHIAFTVGANFQQLDFPMSRLNPSTATRIDDVSTAPLAKEFVDHLLKVAGATPMALWFQCGGKAPIDFILVVVMPREGSGARSVHLRFADAKHTTQPETRVGLQKMVEKAKAVHAAIFGGLPAPFVVAPFEDSHIMLCHNRDDETMLSPSTFTWEPWSRFLFL